MHSEKIMMDKDLKWIDDRVAEEIEPFLQSIRTEPEAYRKFGNAYRHYHVRLSRTAKIASQLNSDASKVHSDLYRTFFYLGFIESYGNTVVDLLVLLCTATGIDFHIECQHTTPRVKHAKTFDDLETERVPLTTKINFLRDNGLRVFSSLIDTKLRNIIAHMKFELKDNGVFVQGERLTNVKLINATRQTMEALIAVDELIEAFMEKKKDSST